MKLKKIAKNIYLKSKYKNIKIAFSADIEKDTVFEGQNKINEGTCFGGYIGYGSYIGSYCSLGTAYIGKFCSIGDNILVLSATHPSKQYVSTHPVFYSMGKQNGTTFSEKQEFEEFIFFQNNEKYNIKIGNDVWIGNNVIIKGGIEIGDGAIIGAGALITKNVEPYSIVGGNPAKIIRYRFNEDIIKKLKMIEWWNWDVELLKKRTKDFYNVEKFCEKYGKELKE